MIDRTNRAGETPLPNIKRTPRNTYLALAKVYDLATNTVVGYIGNISTSGFMLFANEHLPNQALRILSIDLPHPERGNVSIQVGTRIAWRRPDPQSPASKMWAVKSRPLHRKIGWRCCSRRKPTALPPDEQSRLCQRLLKYVCCRVLELSGQSLLPIANSHRPA